MPQSLAHVLLHLVFSTRYRAPLLYGPLRADLHPYLVGVLRAQDCTPIRVGGVADHVHLLFAMSRTRTIAQVVEGLKTGSSRWIKQRDPELGGFAWQTGYGIFSVSESSLEAVSNYIRRQEDHHRTRSFQDELRTLLRLHHVAYDERYVWD